MVLAAERKRRSSFAAIIVMTPSRRQFVSRVEMSVPYEWPANHGMLRERGLTTSVNREGNASGDGFKAFGSARPPCLMRFWLTIADDI